MMTDTIADMLTRIRNANSAGKENVSMPTSKKLVDIAKIMKAEGYIPDFEVVDGEPRGSLVITPKYGAKNARVIRGINPDSFDGRGNYSLGIQEQLIFAEIDYDKIDRTRGMDITFVTTAETDEAARALFDKLGFPFKK